MADTEKEGGKKETNPGFVRRLTHCALGQKPDERAASAGRTAEYRFSVVRMHGGISGGGMTSD